MAALKGEQNTPEVESCAQCHSRRRVLKEGYQPGQPYHDFFATELIREQLYHNDGQILDEVYVHGSFLQSKMYHKGIRCTDCHDPHTARLKHDGNQVCTSCHQHTAAKYDSPSHHRHQAGSPGASCVECHMPETTYMAVDPRRDHSLRTPRPDLSVQYHAPNACTRCHLQMESAQELAKVDESVRSELEQYNDWMRLANPPAGEPNASVAAVLQRYDQRMAQAFFDWYGAKDRDPHWGQAMQATWSGKDDSFELWAPWLKSRTTPAIVKASALLNEAQAATGPVLERARLALTDSDVMVRSAAIACLENLIPSRLDEPSVDDNEQTAGAVAGQVAPLVEALLPLLRDESAQVRMEAARALARTPPAVLPLITSAPDRDALSKALDELFESVLVHADRAGGLAMMANLKEMMGDDQKAEQLYEMAIAREPLLAGPRTNLAALCDRLAEQADRRARQAAQQRNQASLEFFAKIVAERSTQAQTLRSEELPLLARDAALAPENAAVQHRYGLSLYLNGDMPQAAAYLQRAYELDPDNERFLLMLVLLYQRLQDKEKATPLAEELARRNPAHRQLLQEIRQME